MPLSTFFDGARRELGFALRQIGKHPGFAAVAILSLALGLGLNIAMFKVINTLFLQPLDLPRSNELYYVKRSTPQQASLGQSGAGFLEIQRRTAGFANLAARRDWGFTYSEPHRPADMIDSGRVTANFFDVLGIQPLLGRNFRPDEDVVGRNNVILITHAFWLSRYGGDPAIVGRKVRLDGVPVEVVGVLPAGIEHGTLLLGEDIFRPLALSNDERGNWNDNSLMLIGRYGGGLSPEQTRARFAAVASRLAADFPLQYAGNTMTLASLQGAAFDSGGARPITFMLLGLSAFVLIIACANLGNLMLARAVARSTEFAVREALGASRRQVIAPLAAEALLLCAAGGACGALVSVWTNDWMIRTLGGGDRIVFVFDWRVVVFVVLASLVAGFFCCIGPAWVIGRQKVIEQLKSGGRGAAGDSSQHRFRRALIVGQFGLALMLLAGAVFFVRGLQKSLGREVGWDPRPVIAGTIKLPDAAYPDGPRLMAFYDELKRRLEALPGAQSAAISYATPVFQFPSVRKYVVEGQAAPPAGQEPTAYVNGVSPGYFKTIGTHLLRGREFDATDSAGHEPVAIIDADMARALFPGTDPLGRRIAVIGTNPPTWLKIVGIAETVEFQSALPSRLRFELYQPLAQETWAYVTLSVRASGNPATLAAPIARIVGDLNPDVPMLNLEPISDQIRQFNSDMFMVRTLVVAFAVLGLFLAALGIYGVVAHLVALRTREIGIRMALGARNAQVVRLVLGSGLRLALIGAAIGLVLAFFLLRLISAALPGMATNNGAAAAAAALILGGVALVACYLPARRAARINPMAALRQE